MTVNFDNAATTYPKPPEVKLAVEKALACYGSAGRGGHPIAARTSAMVYAAREEAASFFGTVPEHVVFTSNCTHALNIAIQGIAQDGGHEIISSNTTPSCVLSMHWQRQENCATASPPSPVRPTRPWNMLHV